MNFLKVWFPFFMRILFVTLVTIGVRKFVNQCDVECNKLISLGVIGGIMALGSFLINTRSFIIFKLQENVYSQPQYQKRTRELKRDGGGIYAPLLNLDKKLGDCIFDCALSLFVLTVAVVLGKTWPWLGSIAVAFICLLMFSFMSCVLALNRNFQSVINEWNASVHEQ